MSIEIRALEPREREECLALWWTVFPNAGAPRYFERYFGGDAEWLPYYTQIAVEDGRLVSAVHICKRTVALGESRLTLGGIANVATLPEYRGRGLNSQCLKAAIAVMQADAMDVSLLFTGIPEYYARQGFAAWPLPRVTGRLRASSAGAAGLMVRPAAERDRAAIGAIYTDYNCARPLAVERSAAYWRDWLAVTPERLAANWLVAERNSGTPVAYAEYDLHRAGAPFGPNDVPIHVREFGALREGEGAADALLGEIARQGWETGARRMMLHLPRTPALQLAAERVFESIEVEPSGSAMARPLDGLGLLRSLSPSWNDRWLSAGCPRGSFTVRLPEGAARIDATGPLLRIGPDSTPQHALSQTEFFGLMAGTLMPDALGRDLQTADLLRALFADEAGFYWGADGF